MNAFTREPPWRWRNYRRAEVSVHLHLLPWDWRLRAWWDPEVYSMAVGIMVGLVSIQAYFDIGNRPTSEIWSITEP